MIVPGFLFFLCCAFFCSFILGQSIENQKRRRLSQRQVKIKRIINETNRSYLSQRNANFNLGPFGAYITLETWGEEDTGSQPQAGALDQGLMAILGQLTGLNPQLLSHIFGGRGGISNQNGRVINDALPPIIEKYVDEDMKKEGDGSDAVVGKRIEIGGIPEQRNPIFGYFNQREPEAREGEVSIQPKPYLPSAFKIHDEKTDNKNLFDRKGGNRIRLPVAIKRKQKNEFRGKRNVEENMRNTMKFSVEKIKNDQGEIEMKEVSIHADEGEEEKMPEIESSEFDFESDNDEELGRST